MKITESQLRRIIREVIKEAHHNDRGMSRADSHKLRPDLFDEEGNYIGADDNYHDSPATKNRDQRMSNTTPTSKYVAGASTHHIPDEEYYSHLDGY